MKETVARGAFIATTAALLTGCAWHKAEPLPTVQRVCLEAPQETPGETAFLRKKAKDYLADYGFTVATEACDATVTYLPFGHFQGESAVVLAPFWVARSGYWSQEGMVTVTRNGNTELDEQKVNLRGYGSKQDLLADLAWQVARPITWLYQPTVKDKAPAAQAPQHPAAASANL